MSGSAQIAKMRHFIDDWLQGEGEGEEEGEEGKSHSKVSTRWVRQTQFSQNCEFCFDASLKSNPE